MLVLPLLPFDIASMGTASLADVPVGETVQFERLGYFCPDPDSSPDALIFNRTLTLKDTWAKLQAQGRHDSA